MTKVIKSLYQYNEDEESSSVVHEFKLTSKLSDIKRNESKKFSCEECGNLLKTRKSLMRHKRIHLKNIDIKEDELSRTIEEAKIETGTSSSINDAENKKFVCDECGNRLATRKSLKRHKRIHLRHADEIQKNLLIKTKYECEFCKKGEPIQC